METLLDALNDIDWFTLVIGGFIGAAVAYPLARRKAGQSALIEVWDAVDAAESGFHERDLDPWSNRWHDWCAGLEEAWSQMERAGVLARRLPRWRYREIRREVIPLADVRRDGRQGALLHELKDPSSPAAHRISVESILPDDETLRRIYRCRELDRKAIRPL